MTAHARVVIVGGGMMGVGLLYHLVREGWRDVVLCEKGELTSGSTWHAAGLVPHFVGGLTMAKVHRVGTELYARLELETGHPTGWHGTGSIRLALTEDEVDWFRHVQGQLGLVGSECHLIGPDEIRRLAPVLDTEGVLLGAWTPGDGHTDPSSTCNAMAAAARAGGGTIRRHTRVLGTNRRTGGEWEVVTDAGTIVCEHLVNAAGSFSAQVAEWVDLRLPVVNMVHHYLVTENVPEIAALDRELPVIRDPRASCYYRQEQRGLVIGPYEMRDARAWGLEGIDWGFDQELLPPDLDRLQDSLGLAMRRIPAFERAGIKRIVCGPITHTPDGGFLAGPAPGLANYWLCCGASIGITQGAGAGRYLAQWMVHGQTEVNPAAFDPRRYGEWANGDYAVAKCIDEYQQMYQLPYPGEHREAGRPRRTTPLVTRQADRGAVFGDAFGWERVQWFDRDDTGERYGFRRDRTSWHGPAGAECRAVRERVGLADLSSFAKIEVRGRDAQALLDRACANRLPRRGGGIALVHALTSLGGIECEATLTRLAEDRWHWLSAAAAELHDLDWLREHVRPGEAVVLENVTERDGVLGLAGPRARDVLGALTGADIGNAAFPWLTARAIEVAGVAVRALRVSYTGELGWELHAPMERLADVHATLLETGAAHGLAEFGVLAMNALRMEKGYKAHGTELTTEVTPVEADLMRFVDLAKPFRGHEIVRDRLVRGVTTRLVHLVVDAGDADCLGNEPVYAGERLAGLTTSGAFGHAVEQSLAFAYVEPWFAVPGTEVEVLVLGDRRTARVLASPPWDPENERPRA